MNATYPQQRHPVRAITLLVIIGLHLLLYGTLLQSPSGWHPPTSPTEAQNRALLLWQVPAPSVDVATPATSQPLPPLVREKASPRKQERKDQAHKTGMPVPQAVQVVVPAPDTPALSTPVVTAPATPTVPNELQGYLPGNTRRELARIASEMRKESRFPADFNVHAKPDKLAQGIADAYRGDGPVTITDIKLPDGRVMTKVSGPRGSMCIYKDSVGHTGGRDQMQSGVPTKTTTCPQ